MTKIISVLLSVILALVSFPIQPLITDKGLSVDFAESEAELNSVGGSDTYSNLQRCEIANTAHIGANITMKKASSGTSFSKEAGKNNYTYYDWDAGTPRLEGTYQYADSANAVYCVDRYDTTNMSGLGNIVSLTYYTTGNGHRHNIYLTDTSVNHAHGRTNSTTVTTAGGKQIAYSLSAGPALLTSDIDSDYNSDEAMQRSYDLSLNGAVPAAGDSATFRISASALVKGYDSVYYFQYLWTNITVNAVDSTELHKEIDEGTPYSAASYSNYSVYKTALDSANAILSLSSVTQEQLDSAAQALRDAKAQLVRSATAGGSNVSDNRQHFLEDGNVRVKSEIFMKKANVVSSFTRDENETSRGFSSLYWADDYSVMSGTFQSADSATATYYIDRYTGVTNMSQLGEIVGFNFITEGGRHRHNVYLDSLGTETAHGKTNSVTVKSENGTSYTYKLGIGSALLGEDVDTDYHYSGYLDKTYTTSISGGIPQAGDSVTFRVATAPLAYGYNFKSYYFIYAWTNVKIIAVDTTSLRAEIADTPALAQACCTADSWGAYQTALNNANVLLTADTPTQSAIDAAQSALKNAKAELKHNYVASETVPATCTSDGYTVYTCQNCKDSYKADIVTASGHKYEAAVTAPTCTEKGYTTYVCSVCKDTYISDYTDPNGHTVVTDFAVDPDCENTGLTAGSHCSVCETVIIPQEIIPRLDPVWGEWYHDSDSGLDRRVCTVCEGKADGHSQTRDCECQYTVEVYYNGSLYYTAKMSLNSDFDPNSFSVPVKDRPANRIAGYKTVLTAFESNPEKTDGAVIKYNADFVLTDYANAGFSSIKVLDSKSSTPVKTLSNVSWEKTVKVTAAGSDFKYWADEYGNVVSTYKSYSFKAVKNTTLTAVYSGGSTVNGKAFIKTNYAELGDDGSLTIWSERCVNYNQYDILSHGIIFAKVGDLGSTDYGYLYTNFVCASGNGKILVQNKEVPDAQKVSKCYGMYTVSLPDKYIGESDIWFARSYVQVLNKSTGEVEYHYGDIVEYNTAEKTFERRTDVKNDNLYTVTVG